MPGMTVQISSSIIIVSVCSASRPGRRRYFMANPTITMTISAVKNPEAAMRKPYNWSTWGARVDACSGNSRNPLCIKNKCQKTQQCCDGRHLKQPHNREAIFPGCRVVLVTEQQGMIDE